MLAVLDRISVQLPSRWMPGLPRVGRSADVFWNRCLIIDIPLLAHVVVHYGRFDRDRWWSLGWTLETDAVIYYSPDGLLRVGISPELLGMSDDDDHYEQLEDLDLGTLPSDVIIRLADWIEPSDGCEEEAMPHLSGIAGRRQLGGDRGHDPHP